MISVGSNDEEKPKSIESNVLKAESPDFCFTCIPVRIDNAYLKSGATASPEPEAGSSWNTSILVNAGVEPFILYPRERAISNTLPSSCACYKNDSLRLVSV